jgi:hypothetical protein
MEVPLRDWGLQSMEIKVPLEMETFATLEEIASYHGKSVEEVASEIVKAGLQNFLAFQGTVRAN